MHDLYASVACNGCSTDAWPQSFGANYGSLRLGSDVQWGQFLEPNPPANYPACEPNCTHVYVWTYFDNIVKGNVAHGVTDMYVELGYTPTWASSNPTDATCAESGQAGSCWHPTYWADWTAMITAVLNRVAADGGVVKYVEAWNEADQGTWNDTDANLVLLCQYAQSTVHTVAPGALLMSPSWLVNSGYYTRWLNAGMGNYIDGTTFHGYMVGKAPEVIFTQVSTVKSINAGFPVMSGKPIIDSEGGWGQDTDLPNSADQVAFVGRAWLTEWQTGVPRKYWYAWDVSTWGTLMDKSTSTLTPAGTAYIQVYNWMIGATETSACAVSNNVYTCGFTLANGDQALTVWLNACSTGCPLANTATQSYTPGSQFTEYHDLAGNTAAISSGQSVTIGQESILFESTARAAPNAPTGLTATIH
jgi:hypothetical protein